MAIVGFFSHLNNNADKNFSAMCDIILYFKTSQTALLEYKYSEVFVLVFGVICILLSKVE